MFQYKKIKLMVLAAFLVTIVAIISTHYNIHATSSGQSEKSTVPEAINKYVSSINSKDWENYVHSYAPDRRLTNFPSEEQQKNRTGILSVDSIGILEIMEISEKDINEVQPYFSDINKGLYQEIRYFYTGLKYNVQNENEFFYNGVRYETFAVGKLNGEEYILGSEFVYNFDKLKSLGYTFNSAAEQEATIREKRRLGGNSNPSNDGEALPKSAVDTIIISLTCYNNATAPLKVLYLTIQKMHTLKNYISVKSTT
ncbi:hypothetical protein [Paenibacillus lemnae]|uniref:Uncharacterized protein n=1 Tax=Paenibacillus lemnae TaxID=1330551 RepID=A0A848MBP1_PAELE|nr:hypothetical protein [Paenibacillus lemnae]NMO97472.1 hypothetical protein [Paenibacillus lemnae]